MLVMSRDMAGRSQTLPCLLGRGGVKTTENQINWPHCVHHYPLVVTGYINLQPFLHAATNRPFTVLVTEVECLEAMALIGVLPSLAGGQGVVEECFVFCIVMKDAKFGSSCRLF
jgi:hypothetical protein